jgi:hypothetical protein
MQHINLAYEKLAVIEQQKFKKQEEKEHQEIHR